MRKEKAITGFQSYPDSKLDTLAQTVVENGKKDTDFDFASGSLKAVEQDSKAYSESLAVSATGSAADVSLKNEKKVKLETSLHKYAMEINLNFEGNLPKLQKTGLPLYGSGSSGAEIVATGLTITYVEGVPGSVKGKIEKAGKHGTIFACTPAKDAPARIEDWKLTIVTGSSYIFTNLPLKEDYLFSAACKNNDEDPLKWHTIVPKTII